MSRKILPLALIGGLAIGGCASNHPMAASRPAETYDSANYRAVRAAYAPPATEHVDPLAHAIREVDESPDMDAALDAYSFGLTIDRGSLKLHKTFVRRMVDLGVPHLAAGAAAKAVAAEPDAPLARAVLAYTAGREGNMVDALTDITVAAKRAPNEPFIQRTSGHLLAWYDNNPRPTGLPSTVRFALQAMHESLDNQAVFADAYNDAADFYQSRQAEIARGPTTGPTTNPTQPGIADGGRPDTLPPDEGPAYAGGGGPGGPIAPPPIYEPYGLAYNPYPYYDAPYVYSPWSFGWGPGFLIGAGVFVDFANFHHHHHRDFDRGHDRGHLANGDHGRTGDRGVVARGTNGIGVGSSGTGIAAGAGGRHVAAVGRTGVFLPPPTGPRGIGSAAGTWVGRPTASVTGGFENLNTGVRGNSGFGSSLPRSNGYRARGSASAGGFGRFSDTPSGGISSGVSQGFVGSGTPMPAPTGGIGMVPAPAPIVVPAAPSAPAGRSGGGVTGGASGRASGGGGRTSGGGGRR